MKNRNFCTVKTKADHRCKICGALIPKGTKCITISAYGKGRKWCHEVCLKRNINAVREQCSKVRTTIAEMNSVAFGDEGAYLALADYLSEIAAECEENCSRYATCPILNNL